MKINATKKRQPISQYQPGTVLGVPSISLRV
jgi:hypothetical protein